MSAIKNTAGGATAPIGSAGGDLGGSYPNPTVAQVSGLNLFLQAANQIAQYNGTNGQGTYLYNTRTDASNYERLGIFWSANALNIQTQQGGTGLGRNLFVGTSGGNWAFDSGGAFRPANDVSQDLGLSNRRVRDFYRAGADCNSGWLNAAPANGATVTITQHIDTVRLSPAAGIAGATIALPTPLADGHAVNILSTQAITTITWTGAVASNVPTTLAAGGTMRLKWHATDAVWYRVG